jgi:hypothetical protein
VTGRKNPWEPVWPGEYRPHTLGPDCWCVRGIPAMNCRMIMLLARVPAWLPEPGDGGPPF